MVLRALLALFCMLVAGCATTSVVRLDTGAASPRVVTPGPVDARPVAIAEDDFKRALSTLGRRTSPPGDPQEAARQLLEVGARSGSYVVDTKTGHVRPLGAGEHLETDASAAEVELTRAYLRWCANTGRQGDCLRLLVHNPTVTGDGRFTLAMALARGSVVKEMLEAFKDLADPHAMVAAVLWMATSYCVLLVVPEPFSKGVAAVMTVAFISYVGIDTFRSLLNGFKVLMQAVDRAESFDQLRRAGENFGKVMGQNAARAFMLLATAAIGSTAAGLAGTLPTLPGSAQASIQAGSQLGIRLTAVGEVQAVTVTGEAITMALTPGAVSDTVLGVSAGRTRSGEKEGHDHHIATNKWWDSFNQGGPWSPRFQELFDKAGMSLNDPANIVRVQGHKGPHPEAYHQEVYRRLFAVTRNCRSIQQWQRALSSELQRLAREIETPGSELNLYVTRGG